MKQDYKKKCWVTGDWSQSKDSVAHLNHTMPLKPLTKKFNIFCSVHNLDLKVTHMDQDGIAQNFRLGKDELLPSRDSASGDIAV